MEEKWYPKILSVTFLYMQPKPDFLSTVLNCKPNYAQWLFLVFLSVFLNLSKHILFAFFVGYFSNFVIKFRGKKLPCRPFYRQLRPKKIECTQYNCI